MIMEPSVQNLYRQPSSDRLNAINPDTTNIFPGAAAGSVDLKRDSVIVGDVWSEPHSSINPGNPIPSH